MKSKLIKFWNKRSKINNHTFPPWNDEIHSNEEFYFQPENFIDENFNM